MSRIRHALARLWVCTNCGECWELPMAERPAPDDHGAIVCDACKRAGAELGLPSVLSAPSGPR